MSTEGQISKPPPKGQGELPRETDDRPIVRDDEKNPVVRKLDLVQYVQPVMTDVVKLAGSVQFARWEGRIGMTVLGLITYFGPDKVNSVVQKLPSTPTTGVLAQLLNHI